MTRLSLIGFLLLAALRPAFAQQKATPVHLGKLDPELEKVLQERVTALREAAKLTKEYFEKGVIPVEQLTKADHALLVAQLEGAADSAQRVEILTELVAHSAANEALIRERIQQGAGTLIDGKAASAVRLRAQVKLLTAEKGKNDPQVDLVCRECLALLREVAELTQSRYKQGAADFTQVMHAEQALIEADLERSVAPLERVKLLEALVERHTALVKDIDKRVNAGAAAALELRIATATQLELQIELLKARHGAKAAADLEKLQRERRKVLSDVADGAEQWFLAGRIGSAQLLATQTAVVNANLDLATEQAERIRIREEVLKKMQELEEYVRSGEEKGRVSKLDLKRATADRLRAQADLLIEKKATPR